MADIIVHGIPGSPFLRSVEITLKEKAAPYQLRAMSPGDMKTPAHLAMHPFGRIPMFEQGDFTLYETQAIIRYVDDIFPSPPLTPADPQDRARMNQVIGVIESYLFPKATAPIGFNRIIGPRLLGLPPNEEAVSEAMPTARTCFAALDQLLGDKACFGGDDISLADIMLGAQLDLFSECAEGRELIAGTCLRPWLDRMRARHSFAETQPPAMLREAA